jgi:SAM-dependent methyltransferase
MAARPRISDVTKTLVSKEEVRIREAYARRREFVSADRYSCFNPGNVVIEQELERQLLPALCKVGRAQLENNRFLEVGCGHGIRLHNLIRWGAQPENVFGIDLLDERVRDARRFSQLG